MAYVDEERGEEKHERVVLGEEIWIANAAGYQVVHMN